MKKLLNITLAAAALVILFAKLHPASPPTGSPKSVLNPPPPDEPPPDEAIPDEPPPDEAIPDEAAPSEPTPKPTLFVQTKPPHRGDNPSAPD